MTNQPYETYLGEIQKNLSTGDAVAVAAIQAGFVIDRRLLEYQQPWYGRVFRKRNPEGE